MESVPAYAEKWREGSATDRASARRAFERDKDELRKLGIPLDTVAYSIQYGSETAEGYRIRREDFYLPYLRLLEEAEPAAPAPPERGVGAVEVREEEVRLALDALSRVSDLPGFPLADEARSAFRKLAFDLPAERLSTAPVLYADRPGAAEVLETMRVLSDALLARKRVRFRYHGIHRGEATEREVAPYGLFFRGDWYLVGHDATRGAVRVFRAGRMEEVRPNGKRPQTPDYEIPQDFALDAYLGRDAWELGGEGEPPLEARVLFRFPASLWAERNGHGREVERRADGSSVRSFAVSQVNPFLRWVLSLEGDARVLDPPGLRDELGALAGRVAALHGAADE